MLLEFTVGNFLSFKDKQTFTMEASDMENTPSENVVAAGGYTLLRTAAIYGANSSGKSNFVAAFKAMNDMVVKSVKLNDNEELDYDPFLLSSETEESPSYFEVVYLHGEQRIRYGFEHNCKSIISEWLFVKEDEKDERTCFIRTPEGIGVNEENFKEAVDKEENTNDNRLFLSLVAQLGGAFSKKVVFWFTHRCNVISGLDNRGYINSSKFKLLLKVNGYDDAIAFFEKWQLGFSQIDAVMEDVEKSTNLKDPDHELTGRDKIELYTTHKKYNKKGEEIGDVVFNFAERESAGTQKIVDLIGPILDSLSYGYTLVVDELDAKMHVLLSIHIIRLFNDPEVNRNNAQLIFTTHDTHLLSSRLLRRDQIWFTEKDKEEATDLYQLLDVKFPDGSAPNDDSNYERNYIEGRYGAIPYIN